MTFDEGTLTEFYQSDYSKSLEFGSLVLGVSGLVYSFSTACVGALREKWEGLTPVLLVSGLLGMSLILLYLGPFIPTPQNHLTVSVTSFLLLLACSAMVQLNSITLTVNCLRRVYSSEEAMSITLNIYTVAYNLGSFMGPLIGGHMFSRDYSFSEVYAMGTPVFLVAALLVGCYSLRNCSNNDETCIYHVYKVLNRFSNRSM